MQIVDVLLPLKVSLAFSYQLQENQHVTAGQFVQVPFRNSKAIGVIWKSEGEEYSKAKHVIKSYDLYLKEDFLAFLRTCSNYTMIPLGQLLKMSINAFDDKITVSEHIMTHYEEDLAKVLSNEQKSAYDQLLQHCHMKCVSVLEGVTGSGKTLVYLSIIEQLIKNQGQALILLPEIVLTAQILDRVRESLPLLRIVQWHSGLTPKQRTTIWRDAISGVPMVVIGARSALFLPFKNLNIIIVDEEHDSSFKQEEVAIYNARDMAVLRAKHEKIPVILASATPSIETIHNIKQSKYQHVTLSSRFGGVMMPRIELIDMTQENIGSKRFISNRLLAAIQDTLGNQKQALLFLNRKGYAPITMCSKCGTKSKCPNCSTWLVFYKKQHTMQCHYCGYKTDPITTCQKCLASNIIQYGPGVEKIGEEIQSLIPNARIIIATSDTVSSPKKTAALLSQIINHEVDIIIGTQILAKGLDFKLLHLVGIIDADCNYTTGDIRAHERMYQLLHQVSGRAGRQKEQGLVLMQTYEPDHHLLQSLKRGDQASFIAAEIMDREVANMPPFSRLFVINMESKNETQLLAFAHKLSDFAPHLDMVQIMGPSPAPISLLDGRYRYRFIIKAEKKINTQQLIDNWLKLVDIPSVINLKIDVDPYNFS